MFIFLSYDSGVTYFLYLYLMIRWLIIGFSLLFSVAAYTQDAYHLKLLGNWNNPNLSPNPNMPGQLWSELTGYTDTASGHEFVIMGSIDSIYFFDVTDPTQIRLCDRRYGLNTAINRDIETYSHYVYCVSDNSPDGKLQIFDLQYLPDSVHLVYESDTLGKKTHSIFINRASQRLYMCINHLTNGEIHGMDILSLAQPDSPVFIGRMDEQLFGSQSCAHVHEIYVRNDTGFCSCEYKGLYVIDFTDLNHQQPLGSIAPPYPYNGYNHTSWVDESGEYIAFTDEVPHGLPVKIYRIRDLSDMTYLTHFNTHDGATPHNVFWVGNKLFISWYHDGVYIFSMDTPRTPRLYAYYDTYPQNPNGVYDNYRGCWGVYPNFPSGNIAASDMSNGLFMLKYDVTVGLDEGQNPIVRLDCWPSPFHESFTINTISNRASHTLFTLVSLDGKVLWTEYLELHAGEESITLSPPIDLKSGMYIASLANNYGILRRKVVKE